MDGGVSWMLRPQLGFQALHLLWKNTHRNLYQQRKRHGHEEGLGAREALGLGKSQDKGGRDGRVQLFTSLTQREARLNSLWLGHRTNTKESEVSKGVSATLLWKIKHISSSWECPRMVWDALGSRVAAKVCVIRSYDFNAPFTLRSCNSKIL